MSPEGTGRRAAPRAVLDTNVVVSALVFPGGPAARLRREWHARRVRPLASSATTLELVRVLGYPKFRLDRSDQEELLADYLPWVEVVTVPEPPPDVPACRDPFDLPFLHVAVAGRADVLVTGDADLLTLDHETPGHAGITGTAEQHPRRFRVLTVKSFLASLDA